MKKIILFIFMLVAPLVVHADGISLNCPDKINGVTEFSCELSGNTDTTVSSLSANIKLSNGLSFIGFIPSRSWEGDGANGDVDLYTLDIKKGTFTIGTVKVKNNGSNNSSITVSSVFFYDENDKEKMVNGTSKTIQVIGNSNNKPSSTPSIPSTNNNGNSNKPSNSNTNTNSGNNTNNSGNSNNSNNQTNNTQDKSPSTSFYLVDLKIDGYKLDFVREQTEYSLKINDESSLLITPVLEDTSSSYEILGNKNLKNGSIIRIQVTTIDGNKETYRITIEKNDKTSKNYTGIFVLVIGLLILINFLRIILSKKQKNGGVQK